MVQFTSSPDAARVFVEYGFPLGFADLLEDDLLGGLRRDAPQRIRRSSEYGSSDTDLGRGIDAPRFAERHLVHRILYRLHHFFHRVEADRAGLGIHVRHIVLVGAIVLARGNQHRVLHRVEHNLRIDAFFFAQDFDGLKNGFQDVLIVAMK